MGYHWTDAHFGDDDALGFTFGGGHGGGGHGGGHGGGGRGRGGLLYGGGGWGGWYGPYDDVEETTTFVDASPDGSTSDGGGASITTVTRRAGSPYGLRG